MPGQPPPSAEESPTLPAHTCTPEARSAAEAALPAVPGYEILGVLGRGGMGVVYRARQVAAQRFVALKMVLSGPHAGMTELQRFRTEAEAAARMQHPNLVHIYDVGQRDGLPFFSMELAEGGSLAARLDGRPWQQEEAARLVETLACAVEYAHRRGVVHRDLKPANVLFAEDGTPKITDFGLAKKVGEPDGGHTRTGTVLGSPSYMAPEQAGGRTQEIGPPADVYALGAVLYELLTGRPPFRGETDLDTVLAVVSDDPVAVRQLNPAVSRAVEAVCLKCLEKEPRKRYADASALADDLRRFLDGEPIRARPTPLWGRAARWAWRWPLPAGILVLAALGVFLACLPGGAPFVAALVLWTRPRAWLVAAALTVLAVVAVFVLGPGYVLRVGLMPVVLSLVLAGGAGGSAQLCSRLFGADLGVCCASGLVGAGTGGLLGLLAYMWAGPALGLSLNAADGTLTATALLGTYLCVAAGFLGGSPLGGLVGALTTGRRPVGRGTVEAPGEVRALRRMLLSQGARCFGPPEPAVRQAIEKITDPARLERLGLRLFDVGGWRELLD